MLTDARIHVTIASNDLERAKAWYAEKLGWTPIRELEGLLVYGVDGEAFTVFETEFAGTAQNTVAGMEVADLRAEMARLRSRGVVFEDFESDDLKTVDGIHTDEYGAMDAWFRDADGNWIVMSESSDEIERRWARDLGISNVLGAEPGVRPMLAAIDIERARAWYEERLGLTPYIEVPGSALLYKTGATRFNVYRTPSAGTARNTVGMWWVEDLRREVADLKRRGLRFEEYDFGDARTVDGILEDEDGMTAWFTDSEGNILAIGQYRALADLSVAEGPATASA